MVVDTVQMVAPAEKPHGRFVAVAAGSKHGLALDDKGRVFAWGEGGADVPQGLVARRIAAAADYSMALKTDGTVAVWGDFPWGDVDFSALPGNVVAIAAGDQHFALVHADGTVGIYGFMAAKDGASPLRGAKEVAITQDVVVAQGSDGTLRTWKSSASTEFPSLAGVRAKAIVAGGHHLLALLPNGAVRGWGPDYEGENDAPAMNGVVKVAAGYSVSFALLSDGSIRYWGNRQNGEDSIPHSEKGFVDVAAGRYGCNLAIDHDGAIVAWGSKPNACVTEIPRR